MAYRAGLGPVFAFEWLMASRRWQTYALRSLTVLPLVAAMAPVWFAAPEPATLAHQAQMGKVFHEWTSMILLGLVGLAAPAATAGAICQEKARGNLALLFATDLSDAEIILGKLAARLVPVLGMILCVAPVLAIATSFGGVDPLGLVGAVLVLLSCATFGCSLALTLSVWGKKTHEVLMMTYLVGILYMLAAPIHAGLQAICPAGWWPPWMPSVWDILRYNPAFLMIATLNNPPPMMGPVTLGTHATFLGMGLSASALLIGAAIWRLRTVTIRQMSRGERAERKLWRINLERLVPRAPGLARPGRFLRRAWPAPSLDRNPVLWRECRRRNLSGWSLAIWGLYVLLCVSFSSYVIAEMLQGRRWGRDLGIVVNAFQVGAGLLLVAASAATSLAEERQRGSLDVLMATPLPTRSIVWGKWRGAFRGVPPLLILPMAITVTATLTIRTGHTWGVALMATLILAYGASVTSLGLALATWVPQIGRASTITVGLYTTLSIGWIPLAMIVFGDGPGDHGEGVSAASPLMGVAFSTSSLAGGVPPQIFAIQTLWIIFWTFAHGVLAVGLLLATFVTFNRCLGRADSFTIREEKWSTAELEEASA